MTFKVTLKVTGVNVGLLFGTLAHICTHHETCKNYVPGCFKVLFLTLQRVRRESSSLLKVPCIRHGCVARGLDSEHAECGGVQLHNVQQSTPTLVKSAMPDKGGKVKNRRIFKLVPAKIAEFKIARITIDCPPPRSSFLGLSAFCPTVLDNLWAYLLL